MRFKYLKSYRKFINISFKHKSKCYLFRLNNKTHKVSTGVTLILKDPNDPTKLKSHSFYESTDVFKNIIFYIQNLFTFYLQIIKKGFIWKYNR